MQNLICFENYSFTYATGKEPAVSNINLQVREGEIVVICGKSGSGKSTLIRCIKSEIMPSGTHSGTVYSSIDSANISVVFQDPDTQLVNQTVLDNLVFHMENLHYDRNTMRKNLTETAAFFNIEPFLHKPPSELSGGQKQLVVLCAALMTRPKLLLLDEPASQLDPIACREFWSMVKRIHDEFGVAMVITEHRLENVTAFADTVAIMDSGEIKYFGGIQEIFRQIYYEKDVESIRFIPDLPRLCLYLNIDMCFTPAELKNIEKPLIGRKINVSEKPSGNLPVITMSNVFFTYESSSDFVLRNMDFNIGKGEKICILGGNGAGKSTLLKMICGIIKPIAGRISNNKLKIAYMPQNIKSFFRFETVEEELKLNGEPDWSIVKELGVERLLDKHPLDISGGEAQKVVLACILSDKPDIIVMDEPTKALDPYAKNELLSLLEAVTATIVIATHDISFAASFAERCVMLFDGSISFSSAPNEFFGNNFYYTTNVNLGLRHLEPYAITFEEALSLWKD